MRVTNRWNRIVYHLWAPVYDLVFDRLAFAQLRRQSMQALSLQPGERAVLPGVGTGTDLPLLPAGVLAIAIDLSPHMLAQAQQKLAASAAAVLLVQGDAAHLPVASDAIDAVVIHLVLSVVPDGQACVSEVARCLREGGRAVVFDKFLAETAVAPSPLRRLLNLGAVWLGTDLNRRLSDLLVGNDLVVVDDQPTAFGGAYRIVQLVKQRARHEARPGYLRGEFPDDFPRRSAI